MKNPLFLAVLGALLLPFAAQAKSLQCGPLTFYPDQFQREESMVTMELTTNDPILFVIPHKSKHTTVGDGKLAGDGSYAFSGDFGDLKGSISVVTHRVGQKIVADIDYSSFEGETGKNHGVNCEAVE